MCKIRKYWRWKEEEFTEKESGNASTMRKSGQLKSKER